jgi:hypothetical protein
MRAERMCDWDRMMCELAFMAVAPGVCNRLADPPSVFNSRW